MILTDGHFTLKKNDIMESDGFYTKSIYGSRAPIMWVIFRDALEGPLDHF